MKKIIFLTLLSALMMGSCVRTFHSYIADGKGGTYRVGSIQGPYNIGSQTNYVEYCKSEGGALACREVKVVGSGLN